MEEKTNKSKKIGISFLFIISFLVIVSLVSYAFLGDLIFRGKKDQTISTCGIIMELAEDTPITLLNAVPISDTTAANLTPYVVTIKKNSGSCSTANFILNMKSLCSSCTQVDNKCPVGSNSCNCLANYQMDGGAVRYSISDSSNQVLAIGTNPYVMNFAGTLDNTTTEVTYNIRLWISSTATNDDVYVKNGGSYLLNPDQSHITKDFCSLLKVNVNAS